MVFYTLLFMFVIVNLHVVNLLRITRFYIPRKAYNQVDIDCKYDLEGQKLYDVKWYKDEQHFLKCGGDGMVHDYDVEGVITRHSQYASIGSCPVTLTVLSPKASGVYKCEVSLDTNGFPTDSRSSRLDYLVPSKKTEEDNKVARGVERQTSEEDLEAKSGCRGLIGYNCMLLLFIMYFIFT